MRHYLILATALTALAVPALAQTAAAPAADPVIVKVNGDPVLRSQVAEELANVPAALRQSVPQNTLLNQVVEQIIAQRLAAKAGYAAKLEGGDAVKAQLDRAKDRIVADVWLQQQVKSRITDAKVQAFYDKVKKETKPEDELRASHILVAKKEDAESLIKQLKDGADFAKLATEKSTDKGSAQNGGDLGWFAKGDMVKPFADAAFALSKGALTEKPVQTQFGWHVIKVADKRPRTLPPLAEIRNQIEGQVAQQEAQAVLREMLQKANIERFNPDGTPAKDEPAKAGSDKKGG